MSRLSRRALLIGAFAFVGSPAEAQDALYSDHPRYVNPSLLPPIESKRHYPIRPVNPRNIKAQFRRQEVTYEEGDDPSTIVVDPTNRYLYHVHENARATRYGVGVGRQRFEWSGDAVVGLKRRWPRWVPPADMVDRDEYAAEWANGMPGGPRNPLGARALYLYQDGVDTLYRIHGTNEPSSIGKAMSSGCIRMLNEDIAFLYDLVEIGTPVAVLPSGDEY